MIILYIHSVISYYDYMHTEILKNSSYAAKRQFVAIRYDYIYAIFRYHGFFYTYLAVFYLASLSQMMLIVIPFFFFTLYFWYFQMYLVVMFKDSINIIKKI